MNSEQKRTTKLLEFRSALSLVCQRRHVTQRKTPRNTQAPGTRWPGLRTKKERARAVNTIASSSGGLTPRMVQTVRGVPRRPDLVRGVPVRGVPRPPNYLVRGVPAISSGGCPGAQISSGGCPNPRGCYGQHQYPPYHE